MTRIINLFVVIFLLPQFLHLSAVAQSSGQAITPSKLDISGHLRPSFTHIDSRANSGAENSRTELQFRGRLSIDYHITNRLSLNSRFVMKLSSDQETFHFWQHPYLPSSSSGLQRGQFTFDVLNIGWNLRNDLYIELGRMQHAYQLRGLIPKAFDRYHSPNLSSAWSDGLRARWSFTENWDLHAIFQYNHPKGSGSIFRAPLTFERNASRISYFAALESTDRTGLWKQRGISATLVPQSIIRDGANQNFYLFSGRLTAQLPVELSWMKISAGSEIAYAPITPDSEQFGLHANTPRSDGAYGFQAAINFEEIFEQNNLSFLYGYAEPGMLLSPSYRNNFDTWEVRFQHRFTSKISTEIRYRIRNQIHKPVGSDITRLDKDMYARLTIRL